MAVKTVVLLSDFLESSLRTTLYDVPFFLERGGELPKSQQERYKTWGFIIKCVCEAMIKKSKVL